MHGKRTLLVIACAAVLAVAILFVTAKGAQPSFNISTNMNADPSGDAATNISAPLIKSMNPHTVVSVVLILGMAAVGLLILGWGEPRPRQPRR